MDIGHVLVVDDDPQIRGALRDILEGSNFKVSEASNGAEMRRSISENRIDLITLDIGLPGVSGIDLAREIRVNSNIPLIMVTALSDEIDRIVGLEVGADDYVVKPFNVREVLARVRAVLRRTRGQADRPTKSDDMYEFDGLLLNAQTRVLSGPKGSEIPLTSTEFSLLEFLLRNAGKPCSRDEITSHLKGYEWSPQDRSLDTLVARLRRKIEADVHEPKLLRSVRGVGYIMTVSRRSA